MSGPREEAGRRETPNRLPSFPITTPSPATSFRSRAVFACGGSVGRVPYALRDLAVQDRRTRDVLPRLRPVGPGGCRGWPVPFLRCDPDRPDRSERRFHRFGRNPLGGSRPARLARVLPRNAPALPLRAGPFVRRNAETGEFRLRHRTGPLSMGSPLRRAPWIRPGDPSPGRGAPPRPRGSRGGGRGGGAPSGLPLLRLSGPGDGDVFRSDRRVRDQGGRLVRVRRGPRHEQSIPFLPVYAALTLLLCGSAAAWIFLFPGARLLVCPFHALTGLPCPTCGTTRALAALCTGHLAAALAWNPLAAAAAVSCVLAGAASTARRVAGLEALN